MNMCGITHPHGSYHSFESTVLGDWQTALITLMLAGSTGYFAYDGFIVKNDNIQGGIFLTLFSGFYIGSIYSG